MARLALCVLALFVASGLSEPIHKPVPQKQANTELLQKQLDLSELFYHIHEPIYDPEQVRIAETWTFEKNLDHFNNVTAVKMYVDLWEHTLLPRGMPFSIHENSHWFEAHTLFNVFYSAKDFDTFYKSAVWCRQYTNEYLFVYALSVAILHRADTQGIVIPPIYEIFPSFFHNGEIMTTAQRINTHGHKWVEHYPSTYVWDNHVVIKQNMTAWPYYTNEESRVAYFTHDFGLNAFYYNVHLTYPSWLGGEVVPLVKDRRGEWWWFWHKQIVARYYMERLSNGLGEIKEFNWNTPYETGYWSGLVYPSGIPFPTRPNQFVVNQPHFVEELQKVIDYERRIRDAIDQGFFFNNVGEKVFINSPEAIDVLGRLIEANVDSPSSNYYKDFISIWKSIFGNSLVHKYDDNLYHRHYPAVLPSVLEHYETALRDPAFFSIFKRVLSLFNQWYETLPFYKREELAFPAVTIKHVEVDKLVTYFENSYVNVTNHLYMDENEAKSVEDHVQVLVQRPRLNHKLFQVRLNVNSESAKTVVVRLFLAPKYDSFGKEIPLHENWQNFFNFDMFTYDLVQGENVIRRDSTQSAYFINDWDSSYDVYAKAYKGIQSKTPVMLDLTQRVDGFPKRLVLPKGRVGGMPFVMMAYVSEYHAPKVPFGQGCDPTYSICLGSGARFMSDEPFGFPVNRPLYYWQVKDLSNIWFEDVLIHHKHTPEIFVPHYE